MSRTQTVVSSSGGGIGILGFMFLIFMTLKLCGVIAWSWWWVTSPLWIPIAIFFGFAISTMIVLVVVVFTMAAVKMFRK